MCIAMSRGLVVLLAFAAVAGAQAGNYTCTVEGKVGLTSTNPTCVVAATGGPNGWKEGSTGTISFSGTAEEDILAGAFQWQIFEESVEHFTGSGNSDFFTCDNKGCDRSKPISLTLSEPGSVPTTFTAKFPFTVPEARLNGRYHLAFWGIDDHHNYAMSGLAYFHLECTSDEDCPAGSYCVSDPTKSPPYACH